MIGLGIPAKVNNLKDFDETEFMKQNCHIFLIATYGEGDPPDNCI